MKGLSLLLSLLAIAAAAVSGTFFMMIEDDWQNLGNLVDGLQTQLAETRENARVLGVEKERLTNLQGGAVDEINEIKARNTTLEARNGQLSREITQTRSDLERLTESNETLTRQVADLNRQLIESRAQVNSSLFGSKAEDATAREARIADLEREVALLRNGSAEPTESQLSKVPADLKGNVIDVSPKLAFVVLDFGSASGAIPAMEMVLRRGTIPLARVRLTEVSEFYSIAHVLPQTVAGPIRVGDTATRS
jgi:cell division protein FtsB